MAIPDYQSCMLPLLRLAGDGEVHSMREAVEKLSDEFGLTAEERAEVLPSGSQFVMANRVGWARTYMKKAGLLSDPKRGHFQITERGRELLDSNPSEINTKTLRQYDSFVEFQTKSSPRTSSGATSTEQTSYPTPQEALEYGYEKLTESLSDELLENVMACSSAFFERLVVQLLVAMGYGGSLKEAAASVVGSAHDGGIDGIINEDKLGLDTIYVQAKRWDGPVGRPEIQKFAGALLGKRARKGIFATTSSFSKDAVEYANGLESKIVLIDGQRLAQLMIENNIGVSVSHSYEVKRVDSDYFVDE